MKTRAQWRWHLGDGDLVGQLWGDIYKLAHVVYWLYVFNYIRIYIGKCKYNIYLQYTKYMNRLDIHTIQNLGHFKWVGHLAFITFGGNAEHVVIWGIPGHTLETAPNSRHWKSINPIFRVDKAPHSKPFESIVLKKSSCTDRADRPFWCVIAARYTANRSPARFWCLMEEHCIEITVWRIGVIRLGMVPVCFMKEITY